MSKFQTQNCARILDVRFSYTHCIQKISFFHFSKSQRWAGTPLAWAHLSRPPNRRCVWEGENKKPRDKKHELTDRRAANCLQALLLSLLFSLSQRFAVWRCHLRLKSQPHQINWKYRGPVKVGVQAEPDLYWLNFRRLIREHCWQLELWPEILRQMICSWTLMWHRHSNLKKLFFNAVDVQKWNVRFVLFLFGLKLV